MGLKEIIINSIKSKGVIPFRDFMEMALYFPGLGYYTGRRDIIGPRGDYFTSPAISELFGRMVARQLVEMWMSMDKGSFTVVEYGAGNGMFCNDVLNYLQHHSLLYENIRYCIIERSEIMRSKEKEWINHPDKVEWIESITELGPFRGCVFANEVLDNFAVHQIIMEKELMEVCVDHTHDFVETTIPASPELIEYVAQEGIVLPHSYRTEINLQVKDWIAEIALSLQQGFVLTIDYGYPAWDYYHPNRSNGTLMCYHGHQVSCNPYITLGEQDITAHVNFSSLNRWGRDGGLSNGGFTSQSNFLRSLGLVNEVRHLEQERKSKGLSTEELWPVMTLLNGMGNRFKVLLQQKNSSVQRLSGMTWTEPV